MNENNFEELLTEIKQRCDNNDIFTYIKKSLIYMKQSNELFFNLFKEKIKQILLSYKSFKFQKIEDNDGYADIYSHCIGLPKKIYASSNYLLFIHEMVHLIHGYFTNYEIPNEYNEIQNNLIESPTFNKKVLQLMKKIVEEKRQYFNGLVENEDCKHNSFNIVNENMKKIDNKKANIFMIENIIENPNDNFDLYAQKLVEINKKIDLIIDSFPNYNIPPYFQALTHIEGILDSILMGKIRSGFKNDCYYIKGYGHFQEYFKQNYMYSFIELLADYTTIFFTNKGEILKEVNDILGDDMVQLLNSSIEKVFSSEIVRHNNQKK